MIGELIGRTFDRAAGHAGGHHCGAVVHQACAAHRASELAKRQSSDVGVLLTNVRGEVLSPAAGFGIEAGCTGCHSATLQPLHRPRKHAARYETCTRTLLVIPAERSFRPSISNFPPPARLGDPVELARLTEMEFGL